VFIRGEVFVLAKGQELKAKSQKPFANCQLLIAAPISEKPPSCL
jgi:hypothetical protein